MASSSRCGVLLVNLGTPKSAEPQDIRPYLREFLSDPRVIDMNPVGRWLLLNLIILPLRPRKVAEAYQKIWTDNGSPLLFHGQSLAAKVGSRLGASFRVELAMRYGSPSIREALLSFEKEGISQVIVFPLFPQYSSAATGSAVAKVYEEAATLQNVTNIRVVDDYFDGEAFVAAYRSVVSAKLADASPDHVLMSFHGVPERHCQKADPTHSHCLAKEDCCDTFRSVHPRCYRGQCFASAKAIAKALDIPEGKWSVAFQSRFGKIPWIRPYTDERIKELAASGVKNLAVLCPAFAADCLETIEEIGLQGRDDFLTEGGEAFHLMPCLNDDDHWADAVASMCRPLGHELGTP